MLIAADTFWGWWKLSTRHQGWYSIIDRRERNRKEQVSPRVFFFFNIHKNPLGEVNKELVSGCLEEEGCRRKRDRGEISTGYLLIF